MKKLITPLIILLNFLTFNNALAESVREGPYEVHYSSMNTSFLSPDVAKAIGIVRAKNRALLNISVRRHNNDKTTTETQAVVKGSSYDLVHRKPLEFNEVVETGAVYYLAEFPIQNNDEFILLNVDVIPAGSDKAISIEFKRRYFFNE